MNEYCSTCLNYVAPNICEFCDGTEENHIYYKPDFVRKNTKPRYIDVDGLPMYDELFMKGKNDSGVWVRYKDVEKLLRNAPTADVVEVVRCKDCKFSEEVDPGLYICHNENIKIDGSYVDPGWYCPDGKRKEKNNDN